MRLSRVALLVGGLAATAGMACTRQLVLPLSLETGGGGGAGAPGSTGSSPGVGVDVGPVTDAAAPVTFDARLDGGAADLGRFDAFPRDGRFTFGPPPFGRNGPRNSCPTKIVPKALRGSDVILVVPRNGSMASPFGPTTTRIQAVEAETGLMVAMYPNAIYFGYIDYPAMDPACTASVGTELRPNVNTGPFIKDALKACDTGPMSPGCLFSDDRPIGAALDATPNMFPIMKPGDFEAKDNLIVIADGPPGCSAAGSDTPPAACVAAKNSVYNLSRSTPPVYTYVVALIDKGTDPAPCLAMMATQSGSGQVLYPVSDPTELDGALKAILGNLAKAYCTIELDTGGQASTHKAANVKLRINGADVPYDPTGMMADGWSSSRDPVQEIVVRGTWCDALQMVTTDKVEIFDTQETMACP
jgi:hypothetical protein